MIENKQFTGNNNIKVIKGLLKNKNALISIFITLIILCVFVFIANTTLPFITVSENGITGNSFLEMISLLGGGGLGSASLFAIGISPYITSQIIFQILSSELVPPIYRMIKHDGERGRKRVESWTRIFTLPLAYLQSFSILQFALSSGIFQFSGPNGETELTPFFTFFYLTVMTAGTFIAIFLGDLITKRGVGNGISLIILSGILSSFINGFISTFQSISLELGQGKIDSIIAFIVYILFYMLLLSAVVFITGSTRKIPIQQTGEGLITNLTELPYLPIKLTSAGVIPVIFASALLTIPSTITSIINDVSNPFSIFVSNYLELTTPVGLVIYIILIILFTFFYSYIQLNPGKISEQFKKSGKYIPGIQVGKPTDAYITKILFRINWIGSPFLAFISALPYAASMITNDVISSNSALGGTAIIIIVSITLEFWDSIKATATTSSYVSKRRTIQQETKTVNAIEDSLW